MPDLEWDAEILARDLEKDEGERRARRFADESVRASKHAQWKALVSLFTGTSSSEKK